MKPLIYSFLTFFLIAGLLACGKDDDTQKESPFIYATVDGVAFKSTSVVVTSLLRQIQILGSNGNESMTINFNEDITEGQYSMSAFSTQKVVFTEGSSTQYGSVGGTLTITKYEVGQRVEGTFSASMEVTIGTGDSFEIANGKFAVDLD